MAILAGAGVLEITPRVPCHLGGYAIRDHEHEGIHDPLCVRALYLADGSGELVILSADILWFSQGVADAIHAEVRKQFGLGGEAVMLCATHTHSAPTTDPPKANEGWLQVLESQAVSSIGIARSRAVEARILAARGRSHIGINRRERLPSGEVVLGNNPDGPIDREVILLTVEGADGSPIAQVCSFACHGVVQGGENYQISGDWCGLAAAAVEQKTGAPFLFMNGGTANVNPTLRSGPTASFEPVEELASEFVSDLEKTRSSSKEIASVSPLCGLFRYVELPRKQRDVEDGMGRFRRVRVQGVRIGDVLIGGFPGEVFAQTAMAVKEANTKELTMVNSYCSGGGAGYVPVQEAYDTGGYEVRVAPYSEDAEEVLRKGLNAMFGDLRAVQ
jgi:hypothetical protein